jgi:phosphoglycolate phosphatase
VIFRDALGDISEPDLDKLEKAFRLSYDNKGWKKSILFPKVKRTLESLFMNGIRLFIVTNKPSLPTGKIISRLNLDKYFQEIVCPDSCNPRLKSKSEGIRYLLDKYHLHPEQTIYIGDTVEDQFSAKACGVSFIGLQYGYGVFPNTDEVIIIGTIQELLNNPKIIFHKT